MGPGNARSHHHSRADQLADDADVVRMRDIPIGTARHERTARQDEHAKRPALAQAADRPVLERLGRDKQQHAGRGHTGLATGIAPVACAAGAPRAFEAHRQKRRGIQHRQGASTRRPAARPRRERAGAASCWRDTPALREHQPDDRRPVSEERQCSCGVAGVADDAADQARRDRRRPLGQREWPRASRRARATVRLKRSFAPNSVCRASASRQDAPIERPRLRGRAGPPRAASTAPRIARWRPSPVIGSMKPAASPASSSPSTPGAAPRPPAARARDRRDELSRSRSGSAARGSRAIARRIDVERRAPDGPRAGHERRRSRRSVGERRDAEVVGPGERASRRRPTRPAMPVAYAPNAQRRGRAGCAAEAEAARDGRPAAVGGDASSPRARGRVGRRARAGARTRPRTSRPAVRRVEQRAADDQPRLEPRAGAQRLVEQPARPTSRRVIARPTSPARVAARTRCVWPVTSMPAQRRRAAPAGRRQSPSDASRATPPGLSVSPHSLSRGNASRSTMSTRAPARASSSAATDPAGPAPR